MSLSQRLMHLLIALDQLAFVLVTLGAGFPDETLSSAAWRCEQQGRLGGRMFRPVIDAMFYVLTLGAEREHCQMAYRSEVQRMHLPLVFRRTDP